VLERNTCCRSFVGVFLEKKSEEIASFGGDACKILFWELHIGLADEINQVIEAVLGKTIAFMVLTIGR
jgi:hypothetical protein